MKDSKLFNLNNINELNDSFYLPITEFGKSLQFTYLGDIKKYIDENIEYVKYVAQTLTEDQKAQVRINIGIDLSWN